MLIMCGFGDFKHYEEAQVAAVAGHTKVNKCCIRQYNYYRISIIKYVHKESTYRQ